VGVEAAVDIERIARQTVGRLDGLQAADREDICQDVAVALLEQASTIQAAREPLAFAYRLARNAAVDALRRLDRPEEVSVGDMDTMIDVSEPDYEDMFMDYYGEGVEREPTGRERAQGMSDDRHRRAWHGLRGRLVGAERAS